VILLVACSSSAATEPSSLPRGIVVFDGNERLNVRIAETEQEREAGLMNVMALAPDDGMAFVFDGPVTATFWMKDTLIPLSVAFVGEDGRVVSIADMQPCDSDPCPTYAAAGPYTIAVEANLGWFADHSIAAGDPARLEAGDG
jgi:uncharacterized membrane protein (UPF0127 family)